MLEAARWFVEGGLTTDVQKMPVCRIKNKFAHSLVLSCHTFDYLGRKGLPPSTVYLPLTIFEIKVIYHPPLEVACLA